MVRDCFFPVGGVCGGKEGVAGVQKMYHVSFRVYFNSVVVLGSWFDHFVVILPSSSFSSSSPSSSSRVTQRNIVMYRIKVNRK